jgi:formylmethanofuran dehydrogenase subunit E
MIDLLHHSGPKNVKCCKCRKKIPASEAVKIDGELYCKDCAEDENGWRFIEMMDSIGDK